MNNRVQNQKKTSAASVATSMSNQLQSRPFAVQLRTDLSSPQIETHSSAEQQEKIGNFGHKLENISFTTPAPTLPIQPKLAIGKPGDKYEQEADRVASAVVKQINTPQTQPLQRQEMPQPRHHLQRKGLLQRQVPMGKETFTPDLESSINRSRSGGQPLPKVFRKKVENVMGTDFSGVKVHTDGTSDVLNRSLNARAFTTGQHLFFKRGEYNPNSRGGQELIAHELTHVVQQNGNKVQRQIEATESRERGRREDAAQVVNQINSPVAQQSNQNLQQLQPHGLIQRALHRGIDPLIGYAAGNDRSLLYGVHPSRVETQKRLTAQDATMTTPQARRTIDEYNKDIGINAEIGRTSAVVGIFKLRAALEDPNPVANWRTHFPAASVAVNTDPDLQAWIAKLVAHRHRIGLYDVGSQTKVGIFGFKKREGGKLIKSKNRFKKNFDDPSLKQAETITPKEISYFLRPGQTLLQSQAEIRAMTIPGQAMALSLWIYKAFFRRTSKLGIDFAINQLNARINFNTGGAIDHTSSNPNKSTPRIGGLKKAIRLDQSKNRAITISELRHIKKGLKKGTINHRDINFYDEF